eukprot:COSAG05_NODE_440_length_9809_cov_10.743769_7_plen_270_part_00
MLPLMLVIAITVPFRIGFDVEVEFGSFGFWLDALIGTTHTHTHTHTHVHLHTDTLTERTHTATAFLHYRFTAVSDGWRCLLLLLSGVYHAGATSSDVYFLLDIFVNFRTAYFDSNGHIITDNRNIAMRYLKTWFIIDFSSCIPIGKNATVSFPVAVRPWCFACLTMWLRALRIAYGSSYVGYVIMILNAARNDDSSEKGNGTQLKLTKILRLVRLGKNIARIARLKKLKSILANYEGTGTIVFVLPCCCVFSRTNGTATTTTQITSSRS